MIAESIGDLFGRLKEQTSDIHKQVEERIPIFRSDFNGAEYVRLIELFYGFWAPVENKLCRIKALEDRQLDLVGRMKSSLLEQDLRYLGRDPARVPLCGSLPAVDNFLTGVGCLYVLEGSSLGARIISRRVSDCLGLTTGAGASFFNAYGESTSERWRGFKAFVSSKVDPVSTENVVDAAVDTFERLFDWLGEPVELRGD